MSVHHLVDKVTKALPITEIREQLRSNRVVHLQKFTGSLPSFLPGALSADYPRMLILTHDEETAQSVQSDIMQLGISQVYYFPALAAKPYEKQQSADPTILVQRSEILQRINREDSFVVVASARAVFEKLSAPDVFEKSINPDKERQYAGP